MKNMKKLVAMLLAVVMVMAFATTALAADAHTITITNSSDTTHTYEAYQVFAGDYNDGILSNVAWGKNVKSADLLAALVADATLKTTTGEGDDAVTTPDFTTAMTAEDVAAVLAMYKTNDDSAKIEAFANAVGAALTGSPAASTKDGSNYSIPVTGDGYYFVKDKDASLDAVEGESYTKYILKVVGDVTVAAKSETVSVEKTVATGGYACNNTSAGHTHSIADCGLNYAETNTVQIGDTVSFKIESAVPAAAKNYDYYYFIVGDTMDTSLDLDATSIKVFIDGTKVDASAYTVDASEHAFQIALTDAKANAGKDIVVTYEAVLNDTATLGVTGNSNEVTVKYSRNPNEKYDGTQDDEKPGFPAEDKNPALGETPKDVTITYATKITLVKVDGANNTVKLAGATFAVSGTTEKVVSHSKDVFTAADDGTYYKLKDGSYTETAATAEHMEAADDHTAGYVECEASDANVKYHIGDKYYRVATAEEIADASVALFKHVESNEYLYESTEDTYKKTTDTTYECIEEPFSTTATTGNDGLITLTGLNQGTYTITELKAPDGYNMLKNPIVVVVDFTAPTAEIATGDEAGSWTYTVNSDEATANADGSLTYTVENNKGTELPETGGIGTTIFYVVGAVMVAAAGVLLVTKKRMGAEG